MPAKSTGSPRSQGSGHRDSAVTADGANVLRPAEKRMAAANVNRILAETYPDARAELDFTNAYELLIATVLSAQSTDRRVNSLTPTLFARYPDLESLAAADTSDVEEIIKPCGFFRVKAANIVALAAQCVAQFNGQVPATLPELVSLPGVGRKTANVVLGNAFGIPGITPDTHFMRVSKRLGWTTATTPTAIESEVGALFEPEDWVQLCHHLIWHGRRRCHANRPACGVCPLAAYCPSFGLGPVDEQIAAKLVREPRR